MTDKHWLMATIGFGSLVLLVPHMKELSGRESDDSIAERELSEVRRIKRAQQQSWGYPELPTMLPKLGTLPPMPATLASVVVGPDGSLDVIPKLRDLLKSHPVDEIRLGSSRGLGELYFNMVDIAGMSALAGRSAWIPGTSRATVLSINPNTIAGVDTPEEIRDIWLVLYHEWQHLESYDTISPELDRLISSHPTQIVTAKDRQTYCVTTWEGELEAYTLECRLANQWGGTEFLGSLCQMVEDPPRFKQALFVILGNSPQFNDRPYCMQYLAREAGHPHWEAYK